MRLPSGLPIKLSCARAPRWVWYVAPSSRTTVYLRPFESVSWTRSPGPKSRFTRASLCADLDAADLDAADLDAARLVAGPPPGPGATVAPRRRRCARTPTNGPDAALPPECPHGA